MPKITSLMKSLQSMTTIPYTVAPITFRTPISLVRLSVVNEARPKSPRQEIKIAIKVKDDESLPIKISF
jgi:hypothetical protein